MIVLVAYTLLLAFGPWLAIATATGFLTYAVAVKNRDLWATAAVLAIALCGAMTTALPGIRKAQLDSLHLSEASTFCRESNVYVRKKPEMVDGIKFGIYDSYLSPGDFKDLNFVLRSKQTSPDSLLRKVSFVALKRGQQPPDDVFPVMRRTMKGMVNLAVISPKSGEAIAYSNFIHDYDSETGWSYVGCGRETGAAHTKLEYDQLFALLLALVPADARAVPDLASAKPTRTREYDIEPDRFHDVRDNCSKGLTVAPGLQYSFDYIYKRSDDDLIVLVLDRKSSRDAEDHAAQLAKVHQRPILWQHYFPVMTCRNYFSNDSKAGPVFHVGGYEEPVMRIRTFGTDALYRPLDYGPHRVVTCSDTIATGTVRPPWGYILKREMQDLIVADYYNRSPGEATQVTPLITCKGYFDSAVSGTPDVQLGVGGSSRAIVHPAARVLELRNGEYLLPTGGKAFLKLGELRRGTVGAPAASAPLPVQKAYENNSNWPAKPRN